MSTIDPKNGTQDWGHAVLNLCDVVGVATQLEMGTVAGDRQKADSSRLMRAVVETYFSKITEV